MVERAVADAARGKFGDRTIMLTYLDRRAYTRGTEELTHGLAHTMEDEWCRATTKWVDWKGVEYTGSGCWQYVTGPATPADCTPGRRDAANAGMLPADFVERANAFVASREALLARPLQRLTEEEVLAVRLYTGPAYQPINGW